MDVLYQQSSRCLGMAAPALQNYQIGDCLGKGAFGSVYRALNWTTGETVAVKQIQLSDIPKSQLGEIMVSFQRFVSSNLTPSQSEIDLLKNLHVSCSCCQSTA